MTEYSYCHIYTPVFHLDYVQPQNRVTKFLVIVFETSLLHSIVTKNIIGHCSKTLSHLTH